MTPDGVYIRISGSTKAPHWLPHFVPDTLLLQDISYQTYVNGVVASLHRKNKGLWPLFSLSTGVCKLKIENRPRTKLVFWPPSYSKRFIFKYMIPNINSKNICSSLVSFGVMLMKIYYLGS